MMPREDYALGVNLVLMVFGHDLKAFLRISTPHPPKKIGIRINLNKNQHFE
jgi:hypothetical protein